MSTVEIGQSQAKADQVRGMAFDIQSDLQNVNPDSGISSDPRRLQDLIYGCVLLGRLFREAVKTISENNDFTDHKNIHESLKKSLEAAKIASQCALEASDDFHQRHADQTKLKLVDDLILWIHEIGHIEAWLACWSTSDDDTRAKIREEAKRDDGTNEDFLLDWK